MKDNKLWMQLANDSTTREIVIIAGLNIVYGTEGGHDTHRRDSTYANPSKGRVIPIIRAFEGVSDTPSCVKQ